MGQQGTFLLTVIKYKRESQDKSKATLQNLQFDWEKKKINLIESKQSRNQISQKRKYRNKKRVNHNWRMEWPYCFL